MIEVNGKFNQAIVYCDDIEDEAIKQIRAVCDLYVFRERKIRVMPDCHLGKGCVIGFTAELSEVIIPSLIGVDIGCGMYVVNLGPVELDFGALDAHIRANIPSGNQIHDEVCTAVDEAFVEEVKRVSQLTNSDSIRHLKSLGTLGSGNHFIEVNQGVNNQRYLVVHSGSRNFGHQVAEHYMRKAAHYCERKKKKLKAARLQAVKAAKKRDKTTIAQIEREYEALLMPYHVSGLMSFLEGGDREDYLRDMKVAQRYASMNRRLIAENVCRFLSLEIQNLETFETVHNYIDFEDEIIRKGAVRAGLGEQLIIPINMRDGSILAIGKGNSEYNCSAPHGAGRMLSRKTALETLSIEAYKESMSGIYTSSVNERTLDESPMAYKPMELILKNIEETVDVVEIIRPLYNFKAD